MMSLHSNSQTALKHNIKTNYARLKRLVALGLITRLDDPTHSQKAIYSLTEPAIRLVPMIAVIGAWGRRHLPVSEDLSIRAELLVDGGPVMWEEFMNDLRGIHIADPIGGANGRVTSPVLMRLTKAFLDVRAKMEGKE